MSSAPALIRPRRLTRGSGLLQDEFRSLWSISTGDPRVCVAVIDGNVDLKHPCFQGVRLSTLRTNVPSTCSTGSASCSHGTFVASVIFCSHDSGRMKGIAPDCRGVLIPVFADDARNPGQIRPCSQSDVARAIRAALAARADVINISAGQLVQGNQASPDLIAAVKECDARGVLVVSAAGNDGCDCLHMPAALPSVLVVGSTNARGEPSQFSNFARSYIAHGVAAPGEDIAGATPGDAGYGEKSGTSSAAPVVTGLAALLMSIWLARGPGGEASGIDASVRRRVRDAIVNSVKPCDLADRSLCRRLLSGRIEPHRALQLLLQGELSVKDNTQDQAAPFEAMNGTTDAGVLLSCAGKSNCSCGCGTSPADESPETSDDEHDPNHQDDQISPNMNRSMRTNSGGARLTPSRLNGRAPAAESFSPRVKPNSISRESSRAIEHAVQPACASGTCGSGGGGLAYTLGELGYDFGTQARYDAINAEMDEGKFPGNPRDLLEFLQKKGNEHFVASIIWTLNHDLTPIYAIRPEGPYARETYDRLLDFFADQLNEKAHRVSIPGIIDGSVSLQSGQSVPVLLPELRGMYNWTTAELVKAVMSQDGDTKSKAARQEGLENFLERVYYDVRNMGQLPEERALNFAATNAFNLEKVFESAAKRDMQLDEIAVDKSPVCRPDSDCWDVRLVFFNPKDVMGSARLAYRFTVDVSDVVPVLVGPVRTWSVR